MVNEEIENSIFHHQYILAIFLDMAFDKLEVEACISGMTRQGQVRLGMTSEPALSTQRQQVLR